MRLWSARTQECTDRRRRSSAPIARATRMAGTARRARRQKVAGNYLLDTQRSLGCCLVSRKRTCCSPDDTPGRHSVLLRTRRRSCRQQAACWHVLLQTHTESAVLPVGRPLLSAGAHEALGHAVHTPLLSYCPSAQDTHCRTPHTFWGTVMCPRGQSHAATPGTIVALGLLCDKEGHT
jgi:hypothetical protein